MIEIPNGKYYGQTKPNDPNNRKLAEFLFDPTNRDFKKAFEKAAGAKLEQRGNNIHFFADKRENVAVIAEALEQLGKEVKLSVEQKKFDGIIKKLG